MEGPGICVLFLADTWASEVHLSCMMRRPFLSVCEVVVVPYVDAVVAVTVMIVLLCVLHVCLLRECDVARLTAMLVWGMDEVW